VALGCVIRGETFHFEIVAGESARAIMALTLDGLAIGNGILTVETEAQALARIDKAGEAVAAALALLALRQRFGGG
jgi:6,7-dimethyl-8-ribityllumazine synthase